MKATEDELKDIVFSIFSNDAKFSYEDWNFVLDKVSINTVFYLKKTVDYYVSYYHEQNSLNLSIVLYENKNPVGIFPLMVHGKEIKTISSNGVEILEPLFIRNIGRKVKKRIEQKLIFLIASLAKKLEINEYHLTNLPQGTLSEWFLSWIEYSYNSFVTYHMMVDLSLPIEEIRFKFRKSYKPLINKGMREWRIDVYERISSSLFNNFRLLHLEASGRTTRPIESWDIQKNQINSGEAFLITVSDDKSNMVGGGLFTYTRDIGVYSIGAYRRELFDKPIGHPVQMKAIDLLKRKGCKWYEIGQKYTKSDPMSPSKKEISISYFKEGFSTNIEPKIHLKVKTN